MVNLDFYRGKHVLITGHTGFKGSWMTRILVEAGAEVTGYSLKAPTTKNLFSMADVERKIASVYGDVRDYEHLSHVFEQKQPEIVFHLAAQPIVRDSYDKPVYTYETNVMGTVHVCECIRKCPSVKSFLNVTTDKVYENKEWEWGYRENDVLDGYDPYSNSKSCSELVTHCYVNSFFQNRNLSVSTARAGNVIGGGDFASDRIIPDCVRAVENSKTMFIRNPDSTRPYQHVLEPVIAYLMIAEKQYEDKSYQGYYNIGPEDVSCVTTEQLVRLFSEFWGSGFDYEIKREGGPHEAAFLKLDSSKIKKTFGWSPCWDIRRAVEATVEWTKVYREQGNIPAIMNKQIQSYFEDFMKKNNCSED